MAADFEVYGLADSDSNWSEDSLIESQGPRGPIILVNDENDLVYRRAVNPEVLVS